MNRRPLAHRHWSLLVAFAAVGLLGACVSGASLVQARGEFGDLRGRYVMHVLELHPVASMYFGASMPDPAFRGINGRLRDYTPQALAAEVEFFRGIQLARDAIEPDMLTVEERLDYVSIGRQITYILHQLENARYHQRAVGPYVAEPFLGISWQIQQMQALGDGEIGTEAEWRLVVERLAAIPGYLEAARANLLAGREVGNLPDRSSLEVDGIAASRANADYFRATLPQIARRYIGTRSFAATLLPDLERAASTAGPAFDSFATFLEQTYELNELRDQVAIAGGDATPRAVAELYTSLAR